jgi:hypothetical protein
MAGAINGTSSYADDNKSLDFTGRVAYKLPFGFTASTVYQSGDQPAGYRRIYGGDLAWKWKSVWVNGGQNVYSFNGCQTARWIIGTLDVSRTIQFVGMTETLEKGGQIKNGWNVGVNFKPTPQTTIRFGYLCSAKDKLFLAKKEQTRGLALLCQHEFWF